MPLGTATILGCDRAQGRQLTFSPEIGSKTNVSNPMAMIQVNFKIPQWKLNKFEQYATE